MVMLRKGRSVTMFTMQRPLKMTVLSYLFALITTCNALICTWVLWNFLVLRHLSPLHLMVAKFFLLPMETKISDTSWQYREERHVNTQLMVWVLRTLWCLWREVGNISFRYPKVEPFCSISKTYKSHSRSYRCLNTDRFRCLSTVLTLIACN